MKKDILSIKKYRKLSRMYRILKSIQQLSWNIDQFEKDYAFKNVSLKEYDEYLLMYETFLGELRKQYEDTLDLENENFRNKYNK